MRNLLLVVLLANAFVGAMGAPAVCPDGWAGLANTTDGSVRCFSLRQERLAPIDIDFFCRSILDTSVKATSASIHSATEAGFVGSLQQLDQCSPVALGGIMSFGEKAWFDQSAFDYVAPLQGESDGCLVSQCDGTWITVPCSDGAYPFVCVVELKPTSPSTSTPNATDVPSATDIPQPTSTPKAPRATRPPSALTDCPPLWLYNAASGKCYRAYNNSMSSMQQAEALCEQEGPKARLTSIYDEAENAFLQALASTSGIRTFFVGALFMSDGDVGAWQEDSAWYDGDAFARSSPSSPAWPTMSNLYYSNWAPSEPAESFGCLRVSTLDGMWYQASCQSPLPFVCSFINDGSTFPPTSHPVTTAAPTPVPTNEVPCATGWKGLAATHRCYRVAATPVAGFKADDACAALLPNAPAQSVKATALLAAEEDSLLARLMSAANVTEAFVGMAFVGYGSDGMFTDMVTDWVPSAALVKSLWAQGQPDMESGCVTMGRDGYLRAMSCSVTMPGALCSYSADVTVPEEGTRRPTTTADPYPPGTVGVVTSLDFRTSLTVAAATRGVYSVQYAKGQVEGKYLLFSPNDCDFGERQGYAVPIFNGQVALTHVYPVANGSVCFSPDGIDFSPTGIRFTVVDTVLTGIIPTDFADWRTGRTTAGMGNTPLQQELSIQRRSSGVLYLVGRNVADSIKSVRFASSPDCMSSLYAYGSAFLNVTGELASYELIDIQPLDFSNVKALDNDASTDPVLRYFVCIAVAGQSGDLIFTNVPGLTVTVPAMPVRMEGFITATGQVNSTLVISQYSTPAVQLSATGLNVAMLFYLSTAPYKCSFAEDLPVYPDPYDSESPRQLSTALPVYVDSSVTGKGVPYVRFTLNHTRLEGYSISGDDVTFYVCMAMTSYEPPKPTTLKVIVKRQTVASLLVDGEALPEVPSPVRTLNVGFAGMLQLAGLSFEGMSLETISTLRIGLAPSSPASVAAAAGNPCANQSNFYRQLTFPVVDTSSLNRDGGASYTDGAIVLSPGVINKEVNRKLHVCLSIVHAHDAGVRTYVPTLAFVDVRRIEVLYVGLASASVANDRNTSDYATVIVPENADHFVLPLVGYGIRADMTLFLSSTPCFLNGRDPDTYMASRSLLNMSVYDLYDVPLNLRDAASRALGRSRSAIPFVVLTRSDHTDSGIAARLFGVTGYRSSLWMCLRAPGFEDGVLPIPFKFIIRTPYVTSVTRADNATSDTVVYSSTADLIVSGFGLKEGVTQMIPALNCADIRSYLWWAAVPLTTVPMTIPDKTDFVRSTNVVTGFGSYFLSLTPDQTARIGTLTKLQKPNEFQWCAQYDPVLPYMRVPIGYSVSLPTLTGFTNPAFPGVSDETLYLVTVPKQGSDYTAFGLVGSLLDNLRSVDDTFYLAFIPTNQACEMITNNTAGLDIDRWIVVVNGSAIILPSQVPDVGNYKVCYTSILPTLRMGAAYEATLRFADAKGLRLVVSLPTFVLFSVNNTASLTLYTRQEWVLPIDGVGLSNRTVLRITNASDCSAIRGIEDVPVHVTRDGMLIFGRSAAYYTFIPTETTRTLAVGKYKVCMLPTSSRQWTMTGVSINLLPRVRTPTWYNYFSDEAEGNVSSVLAQLPTKIVHVPNASYVYATKGVEMSMYMRCGTKACPDRARVFLARSDIGGRSDPCFVDEFDFPGEYSKGPYVLHDGVLTLTANMTSALYGTMGAENWTLCVETGPSFWRQPQRPHVFLNVRDTMPTQVILSPDDNNNSTFSKAYPKGYTFEINAGGPTRVFYLNGVGIRRGTLLRFGPNCDGADNATITKAAAAMQNPRLLLEPMTVTDKRGAFFLAGSYYPLREDKVLPMCFAPIDPASGAIGPFQPTNVLLRVSAPSHRVDDMSGRVDTSHTPQGALRDTIQLPCMSRGTVDLTDLIHRSGVAYEWTQGTLVMFSRDCRYNTEGNALVQVDSTLHVAVTRNHTQVPTSSPLLVCVRRMMSFVAMTDKGQVIRTAFETATFVDSGFKFQVAAVMVKSVSVSPMADLNTGGNDDVRFVVAVKSQEELVLRLTLLPAVQTQQRPRASSGSALDDYFDGVLTRMTDPAALVAFGMLKVTAGRPCSRPENEDDMSSVRALVHQEVRFSANGTFVSESASRVANEYYVNLKQFPVGTWGDPLHPKSLCMSADGGRNFMSVGIAIFDVEWEPTLAVINTNKATGQVQILNDVNVYENTEVVMEIVDKRFSKHFKDMRDLTTAALANFAELALWDGFLNKGFGLVEGMRLIIASSYQLPGEDPATALLFTADGHHVDLPTGVTISLLPIELKCAESGSSVVYAHHLEPGATYDITPGICAFGLNDGSMVRYAASCANASWSFIGDGIITGSRLTAPSTVAFIDHGTYEVCIKKYLDPADVVAVGAEALYSSTGLSLIVSSHVGVSAVNDVNNGILAFYQGEPVVLALSGSGIGNGNVFLSFPSAASSCDVASYFVNGNGDATMASLDPFAIWVPVTNSIAVIDAAATRTVVPGDAGKRLVCVSVNGGITFTPVGKKEDPLLAMVVPPTITAVGSSYDPLVQTATVLSTIRLVGSNDSGVPAAPGPFTSVIPPLQSFDETTVLTGNGIGSFSQRNSSLVGAIFLSSVVTACNGPADLNMATAVFDIDSTTGKATLSGDFSMASLAALPSSAYVMCTSADSGVTFYSANGNFLPTAQSGAYGSSLKGAINHDVGVTSAATILSVEDYARSVFVARFDDFAGGNRREDDATLLLDTVVFSTVGTVNRSGNATDEVPFSITSFDLTAIQRAFADAIGVDGSFIAVVVSPMDLANVTANSYYIAIKMIAGATSIVKNSDGTSTSSLMTPLDAYVRWVGILTAAGETSDDAYRRTNLTNAVEANTTATTRISILRSSFACSDGWPVAARDSPTLVSMSMDLVAPTARGYAVQADLGSTQWSTIPILLLFPCFMFVATFFAYRRFFGVIEGADAPSAVLA